MGKLSKVDISKQMANILFWKRFRALYSFKHIDSKITVWEQLDDLIRENIYDKVYECSGGDY